VAEDDWDPRIPRSKGVARFREGAAIRPAMEQGWLFIMIAPTEEGLGEILKHDGPRVLVCADCGVPVEDGRVFHVKPETYSVIYRGETFYIERHIGLRCGCAMKRGLTGVQP
jgi:hypothetical protein